MNLTWYQDARSDNGPVISARVRLARNIKKYPFHAKLTKALSKEMIAEAVGALKNSRTMLGDRFSTMNPESYSDVERRMFLEKHIISREFLKKGLPKGLLLQDDFNISIMLNEEDHIRIQTLCAGNDIETAWNLANKLDDLIEENVEYAFDQNYGYLTACPTNVGTGLRASFMFHLPMLEKTGQLKNILPTISKFGIAIRGLHGEGSESMGGIFQISNQITLGKTEQEIIKSLQSVAENVLEKEFVMRKAMLETHRLDIENNIWRAYALLSYGRKASLKEAMEMLSEVRMGYAMEVLDVPRPKKCIYQIMMESQPGHLIRMAGQSLDEKALEEKRAEYLRSMFSE